MNPNAPHLNALTTKIRAALEAANEPCPKSLPEQNTRALEAMAGQFDQEQYRHWQERVNVAKTELVEMVPAILQLLEYLESSL